MLHLLPGLSFGLVGIILGIIAIRQNTPSRGLAIAGIIIGALTIIIGLVIIIAGITLGMSAGFLPAILENLDL